MVTIRIVPYFFSHAKNNSLLLFFIKPMIVFYFSIDNVSNLI